MNIVVLAGGLSTERDVSFKSGQMITQALRRKGHNALLLDVFMGYGDKECDVSSVFEDAKHVGVNVGEIPDTAPDIAKIKALRPDKSDNFFGPNIIKICQLN